MDLRRLLSRRSVGAPLSDTPVAVLGGLRRLLSRRSVGAPLTRSRHESQVSDVARLDGRGAGVGPNQERATLVDVGSQAADGPARGLDVNVPAESRAHRTVGDEEGVGILLRDAEAAIERVEQVDENVVAVHVAAEFLGEACPETGRRPGWVGQMSRWGAGSGLTAPVGVHAYADDQPLLWGRCLDEHSGALPPSDEDVVRPLQFRLCTGASDHISDREADGERDERRPRRRAHEATHEEGAPGTVLPSSSEPAAPSGLVICDDDEAWRRTSPGTRRDNSVRRVRDLEALDLPPPARPDDGSRKVILAVIAHVVPDRSCAACTGRGWELATAWEFAPGSVLASRTIAQRPRVPLGRARPTGRK